MTDHEARVKRIVTVQDAQEILRRYGYGHHADALDALIPEPPRPQDTSDDERKALAVVVAYTEDDYLREHGTLGGSAYAVADAIMATPEWRNRGRGPIRPEGITDEAVEAGANALSWAAEGKPLHDLRMADRKQFIREARAVLEAAEGLR